MLQNMDILVNPQNLLLLKWAGIAILCLLIAISTSFFLIHWCKLRHMMKKNPAEVPRYNAFLLFLGYLLYALLAFICAALIAGVPLAGAVYLGVWLAKGEGPFVPLFVGALTFGVVVGLYGTILFLRARRIYIENKLFPVAHEI